MDSGSSTTTIASPPTDGMFRELLAIHRLLRRDLTTVRRLAWEVRDGLSPETILAELRDLETNSPLWRLRFGCLHYCRLVHSHHSLEDTTLFPMVLKHDPTLTSVIDRLVADHRAVHEITERITPIAERVSSDATGISRFQLVEALTELETLLLAHLTLEEQAIGPVLSTWDAWPLEGDVPNHDPR